MLLVTDDILLIANSQHGLHALLSCLNYFCNTNNLELSCDITLVDVLDAKRLHESVLVTEKKILYRNN